MHNSYLRLLRVHHYIKNLLVFVTLICGGQLFDWKKLGCATIGFFSFCMVSSSVYIINDIRDLDMDKMHPTKCKRPIAAGTISVGKAKGLVAVLLVTAILCNMFVFHVSSSLLLALYFFMNIAYSLGLKDIPLVDISILAAGFLIRIVYGSIITGITVSNWLYLTVIAMAFYFSLGKRRNELRNGNVSGRKVLKEYTISFLDKNMYLCLALANVFYALWSMDKERVSHYNRNLIYSVPIVLLITMKYSLDVESETSDGDPVEVLLQDKYLLVLCVVYLLNMFLILYL